MSDKYPGQGQEIRVGIPENSDAFKEYLEDERRRAAGEPEIERPPLPEGPMRRIDDFGPRIPELSDAFQEWEKNRKAEGSDES